MQPSLFDPEADVFTHPAFRELSPKVVRDFEAFHLRNTHIFLLFRDFARRAKRSGRKHYGIKGIAERVRWEVNVETHGDGFKLNNNLASCYARLLAIREPELASLFETRKSPCKSHE